MKESTTARGYGPHHQRERRRLDPLVQAGLVDCWRCGEQIPPGSPWDLGHDDLDRSQYRGPEHRRCNRATKGRRPNGLASANYGSGGRRAPRTCVICAETYRPSHADQQTCGRACGAELRRRNQPPRPPKTKAEKAKVERVKTCMLCGARHATKRRLYCSPDCMAEANARLSRDRYRALVGIPTSFDEPTTPRRRPILKDRVA